MAIFQSRRQAGHGDADAAHSDRWRPPKLSSPVSNRKRTKLQTPRRRQYRIKVDVVLGPAVQSAAMSAAVVPTAGRLEAALKKGLDLDFETRGEEGGSTNLPGTPGRASPTRGPSR